VAADVRGPRLSILAIVVAALFLALFGRLWYLQVMESQSFEQVAVANQVRTVQLEPMRGRILDSQGRVLADNRRSLMVAVDRAAIRRETARDALFTRLAGVLGTTPEKLDERYTSGVYEPYLPLPVAEDVDERVAVFLKERREDYPGVEVVEGWERVYRFAPLASHIVGYVGRIPAEDKDQYEEKGYLLSDTVGRNGVELTYEDDLRGKPGFVRFEVDARGRVVRVLDRVEPTPGNDVQLTIDLKVQQFAEMVLERGLEEARTRTPRNKPGVYFEAPAGAMSVLDPRSGQVVALATYPTFDNRWFTKPIPQTQFEQLFPDGERSPLVNRAIAGRYQLGSTMKLFSGLAAVESGFLPNPRFTINDQGFYEIRNCEPPQPCRYTNAGGERTKYGAIDLPLALTVSSDVYFYRIGAEMWQNLQGDVLQDGIRKFGLGSESGIDLPYEYGGIVPDAALKKRLADQGVINKDEGAGYFTGDNLQLAIGQGLLTATPLQLANGYATFANGGTVWTPHVVARILAPGTPDAGPGQVDLAQGIVVRDIQPVATGTVGIAPDVRAAVLEGLVGVMRSPRGTAYNTFRDYDWDAFPVAGKTGTAQDFTQKDERDSSLFAAFGPINDTPRYAAAAVLERSGFGAWSAAPVVKCFYEGIAGQVPMPEVIQSDALDRTSTRTATMPQLPEDTARCLSIAATGTD
jgi:penicillin-binding protein 2